MAQCCTLREAIGDISKGFLEKEAQVLKAEIDFL